MTSDRYPKYRKDPACEHRRTRVRYGASPVARSNELENLRRSIAMLSPTAMALSREEALALLEELAEVQRRLERLRAGLRRLVEDG